jgi:uncharacterized BrkB/YihY/UPF0761 family membrane protein
MTEKEPRNILYFFLLLASLAFVVTALAYAIIPVLEQKALDAGGDVPPSPFRDELRNRGWLYLLVEVAAMVVFGLASMWLDRHRRLKKEKATAAVGEKSTQPNAPGQG